MDTHKSFYDRLFDFFLLSIFAIVILFSLSVIAGICLVLIWIAQWLF